MKKDNHINNIIKNVIKEYLPDGEAMLFGSRAKDTAGSDSDFDILVVTRRDLAPAENLFFRSKIRKRLLQEGIRSDILISSREEIETKKRLPGHIIRRIIKEAVML